MQSLGWSSMEYVAARFWIWQIPRECYLLECLVHTVKFGGEGIIVRGCFSGVRLEPFIIQVRVILNTSAYIDILDICMLSLFGEGPFLFKHDCTKCEIHKDLLL